jgi:hypothetical protein
MTTSPRKPSDASGRETASENDTPKDADGKVSPPVEIGGRKGPDPTRYGDWEKAGRCIDF